MWRVEKDSTANVAGEKHPPSPRRRPRPLRSSLVLPRARVRQGLLPAATLPVGVSAHRDRRRRLAGPPCAGGSPESSGQPVLRAASHPPFLALLGDPCAPEEEGDSHPASPGDGSPGHARPPPARGDLSAPRCPLVGSRGQAAPSAPSAPSNGRGARPMAAVNRAAAPTPLSARPPPAKISGRRPAQAVRVDPVRPALLPSLPSLGRGLAARAREGGFQRGRSAPPVSLRWAAAGHVDPRGPLPPPPRSSEARPAAPARAVGTALRVDAQAGSFQASAGPLALLVQGLKAFAELALHLPLYI